MQLSLLISESNHASSLSHTIRFVIKNPVKLSHYKNMKPPSYILLARLAIALVLIWNIQCAITFLLWPDRFTAGFELAGPPGEAALRSVGLLFLMWNIPYTVALIHPMRYRISLYEATAMQAIGLLGESLILMSLPPIHSVLQTSLRRFIVFDFSGLVLLLLALWFVRRAVMLGSSNRIL
jgi:hypothetical protein